MAAQFRLFGGYGGASGMLGSFFYSNAVGSNIKWVEYEVSVKVFGEKWGVSEWYFWA